MKLKTILLQIENPELFKQIHLTKNGNVDSLILFASKKIWWFCNFGHEWNASIYDRLRKHCGCPYCSGKKVCIDNCLATLNPSLSTEWNYKKNNLTPFNVTCNSHTKVWWICKKGHEWISTVCHRNDNRNCPYCSNKKTCIDNCLMTINPSICKDWNYEKNILTPLYFTHKSNKKVWWICKKKHQWKASIDSRTRGRGCPYCSGAKVCIDNCLATLNPQLSTEWNVNKNENLTPFDVTKFSMKKVWWICKKGHEWEANINNRSNGAGCKKCNNPNVSKIELRFFNSIKSIFNDTESSYTFLKDDKKFEIDIFIKEFNIGIEYDGFYYHNKEKSVKNDIKKNLFLKENHIKLIRIREKGLPKIHDTEFQYNPIDKESFNDTLTSVINYINLNKNVKKQNFVRNSI